MRNGVWVLMLVAVAAPLVGSARGASLEVMGWGLDVNGFVDVAYQSKYVWRGFDVYGDDAAMQYTLGVALPKGFGAQVQGHRVLGSGREEAERWDYNLYYAGSFLQGEPIATDYRIGYVRYNYPDLRAKWYDLQELHAVLSWPQATGIKNLVPGYAVVKLWPFSGGNLYATNAASGYIHIFTLDYSFSTPGPLPQVPEQVFKLHGEVVYNDGVSPDPTRPNIDHDWSDAVFGVCTDFDIGHGITVTPSLNYQISMDKTVNNEDELWFTVGAKLVF